MFTFGKYKHQKTFAQVFDTDGGYCAWVVKKVATDEAAPRVPAQLVETGAGRGSEPPTRWDGYGSGELKLAPTTTTPPTRSPALQLLRAAEAKSIAPRELWVENACWALDFKTQRDPQQEDSLSTSYQKPKSEPPPNP